MASKNEDAAGSLGPLSLHPLWDAPTARGEILTIHVSVL